MQGNIFKLKKDKVDEWKKWSSYLLSQEGEVTKTLVEENILFEGSFIFSSAEGTFVCLYAKPRQGEVSKSANLEKEINKEHRNKMKECFEEKLSRIENLYFFETP